MMVKQTREGGNDTILLASAIHERYSDIIGGYRLFPRCEQKNSVLVIESYTFFISKLAFSTMVFPFPKPICKFFAINF